MSDLISRKALLAEYDRVHIGPPGGARKLMEDAPAVQQWIPVTERLPKKQREYLCFCNIDGHNEYPFYMVLKYYLVDEKPHFQHECEHGLRVTHWMELEPPKGE